MKDPPFSGTHERVQFNSSKGRFACVNGEDKRFEGKTLKELKVGL